MSNAIRAIGTHQVISSLATVQAIAPSGAATVIILQADDITRIFIARQRCANHGGFTQ